VPDPFLVKFSMDFVAGWARVSASHEPALVKEVVVGKDMVGLWGRLFWGFLQFWWVGCCEWLRLQANDLVFFGLLKEGTNAVTLYRTYSHSVFLKTIESIL